MANLGDIISDDLKNNLIFGSAKIGDVFRMNFEPKDGIIPKGDAESRNKFFIILGIDKNGNAFGFVVINSVINPYLPVERRELHYKLEASKYEFLEGKDRFVDCSDFKQISKNRFSELFDSNNLRGKIDKEDLDYIIGAVVSYEDAPKKILKKFGLI